jgi:leader peptidase (prepilin peptidase)/N-methyltransferase
MPEIRPWTPIPFHFWTVVFFVFGSIVGSFLNVCIHRMPRGESLISPPSHCPGCGYTIPWYFNIPLATWIWLRGKCANCAAPISPRYLGVELLTGVLCYCLFLAGLIVATFIDFEHLIIPDEITIGGAVVGFLISFFLPALHRTEQIWKSLFASGLGIAVGWAIIYGILRLGKLIFGRQSFKFSEPTRVVFSETAIHLPGEEIPFEEIFYRKTDSVRFTAQTVELVDRCLKEVSVQLSPETLRLGEETFPPDQVPHMEVVTQEMVLPREAMGLGDVKFMMAIGAFLGWRGVVFSLMVSAMIGSVIGIGLIVMHKREWSSRLPYGPYIAVAAAIWVLGGYDLVQWWFSR